MSKADGSYSVAANVMFQKTGVMLSRNNIHYLSGLCNEVQNLHGTKEQNLTDKMIDYLKKKKYNHTVLYHGSSHN